MMNWRRTKKVQFRLIKGDFRSWKWILGNGKNKILFQSGKTHRFSREVLYVFCYDYDT
jgi:hypothetical protein